MVRGIGTGRLAVGALIGAGLLVLVARGDGPVPDIGALPAVRAAVDEDLKVHRLGSGETFGQVLGDAGLDGNEQSQLLMSFREQASPRRMRVGTEITFRHGSGGGLRGIDIALNPDETVRLTRAPFGWRSATIETPAWTDTVFVAGEIRANLWTSIVDNPGLTSFPGGDQARIVDHLDKIFQWQVDFSRQIQNGDYYRFVFEREVRPDGSMRTGRMLAAEIVNQGKAYEALWFDPDGDGAGTYYDREGESVRRGFLKAPLEFRRISSRFSSGRLHPVLGTWRAHRGVDYAADRGTQVRATADGVVTQRGVSGSYGNLVEIRHANGFRTRYAHLNGFRAGLTVGSRVSQADVIGYVGSTGLATGPHLHYELLRASGQVDPLSIEQPKGDPVPEDVRALWEQQRTPQLQLLARLPTQSAWTGQARAATDGDASGGVGPTIPR